MSELRSVQGTSRTSKTAIKPHKTSGWNGSTDMSGLNTYPHLTRHTFIVFFLLYCEWYVRSSLYTSSGTTETIEFWGSLEVWGWRVIVRALLSRSIGEERSLMMFFLRSILCDEDQAWSCCGLVVTPKTGHSLLEQIRESRSWKKETSQ